MDRFETATQVHDHRIHGKTIAEQITSLREDYKQIFEDLHRRVDSIVDKLENLPNSVCETLTKRCQVQNKGSTIEIRDKFRNEIAPMLRDVGGVRDDGDRSVNNDQEQTQNKGVTIEIIRDIFRNELAPMLRDVDGLNNVNRSVNIDQEQIQNKPVTAEIFRDMFRNEIAPMLRDVVGVSNGDRSVNQDQEQIQTEPMEPIFLLYSWGIHPNAELKLDGMDYRCGRIFPEKFTFSNMAVKTLFDLWHHGNGHLRIYPYKRAEKSHKKDLKTKWERQIFSKASTVMEFFENYMVEHHLKERNQNFSTMDRRFSDECFAKAFPNIMKILNTSQGRAGNDRIDDLSFSTVYNKICIYRSKQQAV